MAVKKPISASEARALMLAKLAFSDLDSKDAKELGFTSMTADECKKLRLPVSKAGFKIPYFRLDGAELPFYRYRYMEETRAGFALAAGAKGLRYAQPAHSDVEAYFPPTVDWGAVAADPEIAIVITEGELKAACAVKHGVTTIGLGGVWSFQSTKEGQPMLPCFDVFEWEGRPVYICYDSDGATNPQVVAAETRLAKRLVERGAHVYVCRLPANPPNEDEGKPNKVGLDDYIVAHGIESFRNDIMGDAFEFAASSALHAMNERVVYVRNPGFIWDHETRQRHPPSAFKEHAFSNLHHFEQRETPSGTKLVKVPTAKAWMEWEHRAEAIALEFAPNEDRITEGGNLNTWQGWGVPRPEKGDWSEWDRLMGHLFGDDFAARRYFEQWAAWPIQNPGKKMAVAAAIWGYVHGSGKTLAGATLMRIYGPQHSQELKDSDLEDARFEWAEAKQFILADDITARGDRKFMRKLMTMITQSTIRMNPKYIGSYNIADTINYYYTSNDPDALYMDEGDRRFFIHEVRAGKFPNHHDYVDWMKSASGIAALWAYMLEVDLSDFDPYAPPPTTQGKSSMIDVGKSELGAWVADFKQNTDFILERAKMRGDLFSAKQLHMLFDPNGDKKASPNALARELKRVGFTNPSTGNNLRLSSGQQLAVYAIRNQEQWAKAGWKHACEVYERDNPSVVSKPPSKKF